MNDSTLNSVNDDTAALALIKAAHRRGVPINTPATACHLWGPLGQSLSKRSAKDDEEDCDDPDDPRCDGEQDALDNGATFKSRFTRKDRVKRQATVKLKSARSVVGGQGVFDESGAKVGRVTRISKSADDDGGIDAELTFDDQAAWDKVASATYAGVQCSRTDTAGSIISLVDRLGDDPTGAPKFERMLKTSGDEGRDATAQLLKRIHANGARRLDPGAIQKGQSIFGTRAKPLTKSARSADLVAWASIAADVTIGDRPIDALDAIRAIHKRAPTKCMF